MFAFDLEREAILLVGGNKSDDWKGWYETNIAVADDRFDEHQAELAGKRVKKTTSKATKTSKQSKGKRR